MKAHHSTPVLFLGAASLLTTTSGMAKVVVKAPAVPVKAPAKAPAKPRPLGDAPELTMNRARAGTGTLSLGADTLNLTSATLILMPKNRGVEVAFKTTRGLLLLTGTATRWDNDTVIFSLTRASGPLSRALGAQGRAVGEVKGQAQLSGGRRTFSTITMDGKMGLRTVSASFRSSPLPERSTPGKKR